MEKSELFKKGGIYLLSALVSNFINLFLIPVYTGNMSVQGFGKFSLALSLQGFAMVLVTVSVFSGMKRFFIEAKDKERLKNSCVLFIAAWGGLLSLAAYFAAPWIGGVIFPGDANGGYYVWAAVACSALSGISVSYAAYYSMQYDALKASLVECARLSLTLLLAWLLVGRMGQGEQGAITSVLLASAVLSAALLALDAKSLAKGGDMGDLARMIPYGAGLAAGDISSWALTMADRYLIGSMVGFAGVAVYSVGYRLGMLVLPLLRTPFGNLFIPYKFENYSSEEGRLKIRGAFEYYACGGWFVVFCICVMSGAGVRILATSEYSQAFFIVPFVAYAYFIEGLCEFYSIGLHVKGRTHVISAATAACAAMNIALNLLLIPRLGMYGAAVATLVSYKLLCLLQWVLGRRYFDSGVGLFSHIRYGLPFAILYPVFIIAGVFNMGTMMQLLVGAAMCAAYVPLGIATGSFPANVARDVAHIIGRLVRNQA